VQTEHAEDVRRWKLYRLGLTDPDMAKVLGIAKSTVGEWRKKRNLPAHGRERKI